MQTGIYFRVQRNNEYLNLDLSDMTESEIRDILNTKSRDFVIGVVIGMLASQKAESAGLAKALVELAK